MTDITAENLSALSSKENGVVKQSMAPWFHKRSVLLIAWAAVAFLALVGVLVWHAFQTPLLATFEAKAYFLAGSTLLWLPLLLLLLDPPDNFAKGPRVRLPFATLTILLAMTAFAIFDHYADRHLLIGPNSFAVRTAFLAFVALAFIPNIWNAANFAAYEVKRRSAAATLVTAEGEADQSDEDGRDAESIGALIATVVVSGIAILAYFAGVGGGDMTVQQVYGLVLGGIVIAIFAIVVLVDRIAELPLVRALADASRAASRRARWLADFYNWADMGFVRIGAHLVGMRQTAVFPRYVIQVVTLACLTAMAWILPPLMGIWFAIVGFVLAVSISRLWSWVEDDRALAAMTKYRRSAPYRIGFQEDYREETLVGFIFVFLLVPAAMMQAHNGQLFGQHLFTHGDNKSFVDWFGFFGVELAKAVPIVDWAEIYGVHATEDMIGVGGAASRHAVFMARVMVDLLLIAGLLQVLSIITRNRQQKQLYAAKQIDRLDPFVEAVELRRAIAVTRVADDSFNLSLLRANGLVDFRAYNDDRLSELYGSTSDVRVRKFIEAISRESARPYLLVSAIELTASIAEGDQNEVDMVHAFQRALREHDEGLRLIEPLDLFQVLSPLRSKTGLKDFKHRVLGRMVGLNRDKEAIDFLIGLAAKDKADSFLYGRDIAVETIGKIAVGLNDAAFLSGLVVNLRQMLKEQVAPRPKVTQGVIGLVAARLAALA